jgi:hypothetical protein
LWRNGEPWDSPHNRPLIARIPDIYVAPVAEGTPAGTTIYLLPRGQGTLFENQEGPRIEAISDGCAAPILVVEADVDRAVPWTKPDDLELDPAENPLEQGGIGGRPVRGWLTPDAGRL